MLAFAGHLQDPPLLAPCSVVYDCLVPHNAPSVRPRARQACHLTDSSGRENSPSLCRAIHPPSSANPFLCLGLHFQKAPSVFSDLVLVRHQKGDVSMIENIQCAGIHCDGVSSFTAVGLRQSIPNIRLLTPTLQDFYIR